MDEDRTRAISSRITSRRRLLQASTAGAASLALARSGGLVGEVSAAERPASMPLAVGFSDPESGDMSLVDAAGLPSGDDRLSGGIISVRVAPLWPAGGAGSLEHVERMMIDLVNPFVPEAPVMAWWYSAWPVPQSSTPVTHRIPSDGSGLTLQISYRLAGAEESVTEPVHLTSGSGECVPKLQSGTYCIALPGAGLHDWGHLRLLDVEDGDGRVYRCLCEQSGTGDVPCSIPYVLVTIS